MNEDNDKKNPPTADHDHKKPGDGDGKLDSPDAPIHFKVNGVELVSEYDKLVAFDILKMAKAEGAFEGKPEDYILEDADKDQKYKPDDWVQLRSGVVLMAVLQGSTPVATGG